jgi:hypothetical protein
MRKTSIYLEDADLARVRRIARQQGKSQADFIRDAIKAHAAQTVPERYFSFLGSFEGDGRSVKDVPEEELLEGFGSWP